MFTFQALQTTLKSKQIEMQQIKELGEVLVELSEDSPQVRQCIKTSLSNMDELKGKLDASVKQVSFFPIYLIAYKNNG